ncbi:ABC transporter substrate-binding protein [Dehalococcoidia bacterium]|nr:ABC transporter substrate-binding protein [Dehalococcoidia bacterium]
MVERKIFSIPLVMLLAMSLVAIGCPRPVEPIKIGVIGPMEFIQGRHHWYGAVLAKEEINAGGGIWVGADRRPIRLVKADSNELLSVRDAVAAMEELIAVQGVDFVVGGYEIVAALAMQTVAMNHRTIWLGCGVAVSEMCRRVGRDYERYKYWFRVGPSNSLNIGSANLLMLEMVGNAIREELGIKMPRVAIVAEEAAWVDQFGLLEFLGWQIPALDMEIVGVWRPAPEATDVSPELMEIQEAGAQIILFFAKGPVGITFSKQWNKLQIPATLLGINLEAMKRGFWEATEGRGEYTMFWHTIGRVEMTPKTIPFHDKFVERFGEYPFITAVTYDAIYLLRQAIEAAGTLDPDPVVAQLYKIDYHGAFGRIMFTERDFYQAGYALPHCLKWGPGYATMLGLQWQDGKPRAVWPWEWEGVTHEGTLEYRLPPWVIEYWRE